MSILKIDQLDLTGKKVLVRFDFNVPLKNQEITDSTRIDLALPTIRAILEKNPSKLIIMSHLGRPKGKMTPELSLEPVAKYLASQLNQDVFLTESCLDPNISRFIALPETKIILLENLRFHPEEEQDDKAFAQTLASYGDVYINDAFGTAHRRHASTHKIASLVKERAVGLLMEKEISSLSVLLERPEHPFIAIVGGAKVSDKIKTLEKLMVLVDRLFIGGAMAYPFLKAQGKKVGKSLCSEEDVKLAQRLLSHKSAQKITLPLDHQAATAPKEKAQATPDENIPDHLAGFDLGPKTIRYYLDKIATAKTVFWNGPMGLFEEKAFSQGTNQLAEGLAKLEAFRVVGGGDSVKAINKGGFANSFDHISTGGGASLEYIEQGSLPGIQALKFGKAL